MTQIICVRARSCDARFLVGELAPRVLPRAVMRAQVARLRKQSAMCVDKRAMRGRFDKRALVMLTVDFDERATDHAQRLRRRRLIVDESARSAVRRLNPAQNNFVFACEPEFARGDMRGMVRAKVEYRGHLSLLAAGAHERSVAASAKRQHERVEQNRFSGAGFAGERRQARPEFEIERVNQHDVANGETDQHGNISTFRCVIFGQGDARWIIVAQVDFKTGIIVADVDINHIRALLTAKPRPVGWTERRARIEEVGAVWPVATDIALKIAEIGALKAEWSLAPGADPSRALLFFHGGGYCSGSIVSHRRMATEAGRAARARTLAVAYRLAPEHPFPAAYDDALAAWRFLLAHGVAPERIAIGGDSAGGGLALALMLRLRDAGEALPGCAWLCSPWTDLTLSGDTLATKEGDDPLIHKPYLEELAGAYVPTGVDRMDPRVSPLFADLRGLPPLLIQVGSSETLLADSTRLACAAGAANTTVTLEIWPHMIHAWQMWNARLAEGRRALATAGAFIHARTGG